MRANNTSPAATSTTLVAADHTVVLPTTLRAKRIALVQVTLQQRYRAAKVAKHASVVAAAQKVAYMQALAALQAQYGVPAAAMQVHSARVASERAPHGSGVCAQVHALAALHNGVRKATLAACAAAGINPATAATQFAKWQSAHKVA